MSTNTNPQDMAQPAPAHAPAPPAAFMVSARTLMASAAVFTVLIIVRLAMMSSPAQARTAAADVVSTVGDYTALTLGADTDDVLVVMDGRSEALSVYRVKNKNAVEMLLSRDLKSLFLEGKRMGSGTR